MNKNNIFPTLILLVFVIIEYVDCLRCYECGVFVQTSVTPCQNLTREHLKECRYDYCSKYVGLSAVVYACEQKCTERSHGSFESYCCQEDRCNGAPARTTSPLFLGPANIFLANTILPLLRSFVPTTATAAAGLWPTTSLVAIITTILSASLYSVSLILLISTLNSFLLNTQ